MATPVFNRFNNNMKVCDTDFSMFTPNHVFPNDNVRARNVRYKFERKLFNGSYGDNIRLTINVVNSKNEDELREIPYNKLTVNKFKLQTNTMDSIVFGSGDIDIRYVDDETTSVINNLVDRTHWLDSVRSIYRLCAMHGNAIARTNKYGMDAIEPYRGFKIVDSHNKNKILAICIYEFIKSDPLINIVDRVRIELHSKGQMAESVFECCNYDGGGCTLGSSIEYEYNNRIIKRGWTFYNMPKEDASTCEWLTFNKEADVTGVYGISDYWDFANLVFKLEEMISIESYVCEANAKPMLAVANKLIKPDEENHGYKLALIDGGKYNIVPLKEDGQVPEFIQNACTQLEYSKPIRDDIDQYIYELMEINEAVTKGAYKGQISDETLQTAMKPAQNKAERQFWSIYYDLKQSLYTLCLLNDINVSYDKIEIIPNIGVNENKNELAKLSTELVNNKILSRKTIRRRYYGLTDEQSDKEDEQIGIESNTNSINENNNLEEMNST